MNQPSKNAEPNSAMLFAKLGDTSNLIESLGKDEAAAVIEWCLEAVRSCSCQYGGWEVEHTPGGVFAFYYRANEAIIAATNIQTSIRHGQEKQADYLGIKIGISYGPSLLHQVDGEYTETVRLAAALCGAAPEGRIVASPALIDHASTGWQKKSRAVRLEQIGDFDPAAFEISWPGDDDVKNSTDPKVAPQAQSTEDAAILFADLGYVDGANQSPPTESADSDFARCATFMKTEVEASGGRVVQAIAGDLLARFASVDAAIEAAIAIQNRVSVDKFEDGSRLGVGIAIAYGPTQQTESGDVFGESVDVAAKLCNLADRGSIIGSGEVFFNSSDSLKATGLKFKLLRHSSMNAVEITRP